MKKYIFINKHKQLNIIDNNKKIFHKIEKLYLIKFNKNSIIKKTILLTV